MIAASDTSTIAIRSTAPARTDFISFADILRERACRTPDSLAYTFIQDAAGAKVRFTYGQLFLHAAALAGRLQKLALQERRILLALHSDPLFVIAFFACMLAGATAVPAAPLRRDQLRKHLNALANNSAASAVMTDTDDVLLSRCGSGRAALLGVDLRDIDLEEPDSTGAGAWRAPRSHSDLPALLQYSDGMPGNAQGVSVSHGHLASRTALLQSELAVSRKTTQFVAQPLSGKMGLITGVLLPVYAGNSAYLIPPALLDSAPQLWLQTISRYRIAVSGGSNFMFDLALRNLSPEHLEYVDLSCWRTAYCGDVASDASILQAFTQKFSALGFAPATFLALTIERAGMVACRDRR